MTQFYIFKNSAKQNLEYSDAIEQLKDFLASAVDKSEPLVKRSANQFVVSFDFDQVGLEEIAVVEVSNPELDEIEERDAFDDGMKMEVEVEEEDEEVEPFYEVETINEDSEVNLTDQEYDLVENLPESDVKDDDNCEIDGPEKIYQCECGAEALSLAELQKHMNSHKRKSNVMCCEVGFRDYKCFTIHQKAHENFDAIAPHLPSHSCNNCRVMFAQEEDLIQHLTQHHNNSDVVLDFLIDRRGSFEEHFLRQLTKQPEASEPDVDEESEDLWSCGHCKKKINAMEMKVHLLFFHTNTVFCPLDTRCFEGTKQVRLFSDHIRNKHPELFDKNTLYSCRHCNQSFTTNFEKLAHMKQCDAKLFACENHCNKRFATEWLLKNHMKQAKGDESRYACETCGKRCVSKSDLQIHNRSHTNERPYSCPICLKRFKTSANRSSHLDIHDNEKKHECEVCGEKFQTRPILRKHKKKHDEKYQEECVCKICERKYISKPHLLRHVKASHGSPAELTTDGMNSFFDDYLETQGR